MLVQTAFAVFSIYIGWRFYLFYSWAMGQGEYVARPPAVEAFLPISALLSLKRLALTGKFDTIHPAGLVIFMAILTVALLARKGFCGWMCPVGFMSNLVQRLGVRWKINRSVPCWLDYALTSLKYFLLAFFLYIICWKMDLEAITSFLQTPYNLAADTKMLQFFLAPSSLTLGVLLFLMFISFVIPNFWCRYLCPYGALLGILAFFSPFQVNRNQDKCIGCKRCDRKCPGGIKVSRKETVRSPECTGCLECVAVCPKDGCLSVNGPESKKMAPWLIPVLAITIFSGFWVGARISGHWQSQVEPQVFKQVYKIGDQLEHPDY